MRDMVKLRFVLLALFAAPAAAASDKIIPLDTTGPRPTAQLTVLDRAPVAVIFDSGAGGTIINPDFARAVGLPNQGDVAVGSPGGQRRLPGYLSALPAARLGEADVTGARVVVADLGLPLPGISGVMSPNMFRGSLVRFELAKSRVVIAEKTPASLPQATAHAYHGSHPLPSIEIDIVGVKVMAHLDTGSGRGLMLPLEAVGGVKLKKAPTPTRPARMAGGERPAFLSQIDGQVRIGPLTLTDPEVTLVEHLKYANVGFSILKEMTVVLDPAEQRGWLIKAE